MALRDEWEGYLGVAASAERWRKALERIHTTSMEVDLKPLKTPTEPVLIRNTSAARDYGPSGKKIK